MRETIYKFRYVILTFFISIILIVITAFIGMIVKMQNETAVGTLSDINNQIASLNVESTKIKNVTKDFLEVHPDGLDESRISNDNVIIWEWVRPAFEFNNSTEYNENRNLFVERLGSTHPFVVDVIPPYVAVSDSKKWDDDGTRIHSSVSQIETYVIDFDKDGTYEYAAILNRSSYKSSGAADLENTGDVMLTYKIDASGNVVDFNAAMPSTIKK